MTEIGFAVIGAGTVATYHAGAITATPGARLVAVHHPDPARAAGFGAQFGVPGETSFEQLLARRDVDVVCVCTPSGYHASQTIAAAQVGKHVLVEKPMALTLTDADAMITACRQARVWLAVALQRRTDPVFQAVQAALAASALGKVSLGIVSLPYWRDTAYYRQSAWHGTWELDGGGALMNQGIHLVDLLRWYLGPVATVQAAMTTRWHPISVEDTLTANLRFASGALGIVAATTAAFPGHPHRIEIYGVQGSIQIQGETITGWQCDLPCPVPIQPDTAIDAGAGSRPTGINIDGHQRLIGDFVEAVAHSRPPCVPGEIGREPLEVVLACYDAARSGMPVSLAQEGKE